MSVFNNSIRDLDYHILSFLKRDEQINFCTVNKTAYKLLSNEEYFKKQLLSTYSLDAALIEKFNAFSDRHPKNAWKVACCVLQSGQFNLSKSFFNEAVPFEIKHLKTEKAQLEFQLATGEKCLNTSSSSSTDELEQKLQSIEEILSSLEMLTMSEDPMAYFSGERDSLLEMFKGALYQNLMGSVLSYVKSRRLSEADLENLYSTFKKWQNFAQVENLDQAMNSVINCLIGLEKNQNEGINQANVKRIILEFRKRYFNELIEAFVAQPKAQITMGSYVAESQKINNLFPNISTREITEVLLRAVIKKDKEALLGKKS